MESPTSGDLHYDPKTAIESLRAYLPIYDSYQNQKEALMVAVTAFYLGGASAIIATDKPFWRSETRPELTHFVAALIAGACCLALAFAVWEFELRRSAGEIYRACNRVLARWVAETPDRDAIQPIEPSGGLAAIPLVRGFLWPRALCDELMEVHKSARWYWFPRAITCGVILLWTAVALWRVYLGS